MRRGAITQNSPNATIYCPYADREVPLSETTEEHIVSLALGGSDRFVLRVHGSTNSLMGTKIDGEMCKEFVINQQRARHDARGHSGRPPSIVTPATDASSGRPLQLRWGQRLSVYDPIAGETVKKALNFAVQFQVDMDIRLRFLAKVFLSGGYFAYGEPFRSAVDLRGVRLLMARAPRDMSAADHKSMNLRYLQWWGDDLPPAQRDIFQFQNDLCSLVDGSFISFVPGPENFGIFGSVLGAYLGMLNVPADTSRLPREGDYELGHVIVLRNKRMRRLSLRSFLNAF
jgi:hypothetical protein